MQQNAGAEEYARADLWYDGRLIPAVAVRPKGNSSLRSAISSGTIRFSLKVDINFFNSTRNLDGVKKLNFNSGFSDPTFIREVLAYQIFEQMGLPTPRASFVDLWINDSHLGLYTMVEQIDKTFLSHHFEDSSGNLYKPEVPAAHLNWTEADIITASEESAGDVNLGGGKLREIMAALGLEGADEEADEEESAAPQGPLGPVGNMPFGANPPQDGSLQEPARGFEPGDMPGGMVPAGGVPSGPSIYLEQMGLKTNENNPDYSALLRLLDVLNNEPDETFAEEIEKVLDVDQVLRFLAVSDAIVHLDNYIGMGHNYYLYEVDGRFTIIPWDLNMAFGTFAPLDRDEIINFYIDEPSVGPMENLPLLRLLYVEPYLERYHAYLEELIEGPFSPEVMNARIDELAGLIRPYVEADELKFFTTEEFEKALSQDIITVSGGRRMVMPPPGLKTFIAQRVESIRQQLNGERPSASSDGSGNGGRPRVGVGG
jgi:hypothetical protein